jgi:methyl-accepting chemotaxis protein
MADMINENVKKIQQDIQKDIKTVEEIREFSDKMASGDFSKSITQTPANPQIEELRQTLNNFVKNIKKTFDSILEILDEYKKEDYSRRLKLEAKGEIKHLIDGVNALGDALEIGAIKIAKSLTEKSNILKNTSETLAKNIDSLSNALTTTSKNIDIVSEKTADITENIKNTVDKINKMKQISDETADEALKGEKLALDTLKAMQEIADSTKAIQEAITIIDSIAFQTNILSLNAAVEAATAGEAGKGFAVVAGEVRNLANKSAAAAKKIKELVNKTEIKASEGIEISDNMKNNFLGVVDKINVTSKYVSEITEGANMEAKKIEEINNSIKEIHSITDSSKEIMQSAYVVTYDLKQISNELYDEVNKANNG